MLEGDKPISGALIQVNTPVEISVYKSKEIGYQFTLGSMKTDESGRFQIDMIPSNQNLYVGAFFRDEDYLPSNREGRSQEILLKPGENLELQPFNLFVRTCRSRESLSIRMENLLKVHRSALEPVLELEYRQLAA